MQDCGIKIHRKSNAFKEIFEAYEVGDYKGIVDEYLARRASDKT